MKCPKCEKNNLGSADYCVWCGTPLFSGVDARGRPVRVADGLPEIKRQIDDMAARLSKVESRVERISDRIGLETAESRPAIGALGALPEGESAPEAIGESFPVEVLAAESPAIAEPRKPVEEVQEAALHPYSAAEASIQEARVVPPSDLRTRAEAVAAKPAPVVPLAAETTPARPVTGAGTAIPAVAIPAQEPPKPREPSQFGRKMREWEQSLPGNWLSRIGMLVLFIGLGFLTQWAVANDKLVRVPLLLAGLACGGVLLLAGHHWRKTYGAWAQALTGGGIGVLYLSFFASYALYAGDPAGPVMSFYATFGLMFLVTVLAVLIALRRNSMAIAIIGIVGAFLVPIILGASALYRAGDGGTETNPGLMIAYILVLDAGIVGLSTFRKWRWFTLLGFAGSLAVYGLWYAKSGHDGSVAAAEWSLTGIFLCFAAATTLFHVVWRRTPKLTDLALMTLNAAVYFCVSYGLLWGDHQEWLGLFSVGLSALYAMTGYLAWRRSDENRRLSLFAYAIAIVFLTIAIPVQLHRSYASWITAAWAVEGAALIWIAVRQKMPKWQLWGFGALAIALLGLFFFNRVIDVERFRPFINNTFWAFTISILAFYAAAFFLRRKEDALQPWFFPVMMLTASVLTLWLFSSEIVSAAGSKIIETHDPQTIRNIENARTLGLVGLWVAYGLGVLFVGARKNWDWMRVPAYGLMAAACGLTMVLLNHGYAMVRSDNSHPVVNYAFGGFAVCTVGLYLAARLIAENRERLHKVEGLVCTAALLVANVLTVWALSAEIVTFVRQPENLQHLLLVGLWMLYGFLVMVVGVWRKGLLPRLGGYALMVAGVGATMVLLNHRWAEINPVDCKPIVNYSFGGFAICTAILYLVGRTIADNRERLHKLEGFVCTAALLAANVLTVWVLSAEIGTFVQEPENLRHLLLVALWMGYGCLVMVVGVWRKALLPRLGGYALTVAGIVATTVLLNYGRAGINPADCNPIINFSFGGFAVCTVALYVMARVIAQNRDRLQEFEKVVCIVALAAANVLTLWAFSAEIVTFVDHPVNLKNLLLVMLWVGYGGLLMAVGVWRRALLPRLGACALMCLSIGATVILLNHWWADITPEHDNPIINFSFGAFAVCTAGLYIFAYLTARPDEKPSRLDQVVYPLALALASVLTVWALSSEVVTFIGDANLRYLVLVILWSGYGLLLTVAGVWKGVPVARFGGYGLIAAAAALALVMLNHGRPGLGGGESNWVANYSFGGLCVGICAIYLAAYLVASHRERLLSGEKAVLPMLIVAANLLTIYALSTEVWTYAGGQSGKSMGLTMLWAAYGIVLVVVGILGKWGWVRLGGLVLVGVAVLKLFLLDTLSLDPPYRVAAYITVGVLLLAGGFVYHRYADVIKGFIMDRPEKGAGSALK